MNTSYLNRFESEVKAVLDADYDVSVGSRSSYEAVCENVSIRLADDNGQAEKQVAWKFDTLQNTYEINVVTKNPRTVWKGKGISAKEAYQNLGKLG